MKTNHVLCRFIMALGSVIFCVLPIAAIEVVNPGFEMPVFTVESKWAKLNDGGDGLEGGWRFNNGGITLNTSPWVAAVPEGTQCAFLHNVASMWQTNNYPVSGTYTLTFKAANRNNYTANNLFIFLGGSQIAAIPYSAFGTDHVFQSFSVDLGAVKAGDHELKLYTQSGPVSDTATVYDEVAITLNEPLLYWNPAALSGDWGDIVWSDWYDLTASKSWNDDNAAFFAINDSYSVTNNSTRSTGRIVVENGNVFFTGNGSVATDTINIAAGATLSGAAERYLKAGATDVNVNGTLNITAQSDESLTVNLAGGTGTVAIASTLTVNGTPTFAGAISGNGGVNKIGDQHLIVNNSFSGSVDVQSGYLSLLNAITGTAGVEADAGLAFANGTHLTSALNNSANDFAAGAMVGLYAATDLSNPDINSINFGDQRFLKLGSGMLKIARPVLSLASVTAGVEVVEGILHIREGTAAEDYEIPDNTPITVHDGATLQIVPYPNEYVFKKPLFLSGNYSTDVAVKGSFFINKNSCTFQLNAPITLLNSTKIKAYSSTSTVNFNAPITGSGNLIIAGGGAGDTHLQILNFNVPSTFDGNVILQNENNCSAKFNWNVDNALPSGATLSVGGNVAARTTELDLKGFVQQTAGVADSPLSVSTVRDFVNSAATPATLEMSVASGDDLNYTGKVRGSINLIKRGGGIQSLRGAGDTYSGSVLIEDGTLRVNGTTLQNASEVTVADGGQIQPLQTTTTIPHLTIAGSGTGAGSKFGAIFFAEGNKNWNGDITLAGDASIGSFGGGIITKTINGTIDGEGSLRVWAGGGFITHENVYVFTQPATFDGALYLDAVYGASLTLKLSGADNLLRDGVPVRFNTDWQQVFCRLDLMGTSAQRVGSLYSIGKATQCRAVVNSVADTTSTLTINTLGGTSKFEGVIGASGPCLSPGAINLVKEGPGAQIFIRGSEFIWIDNTSVGTNVVNANIIVNNGAIGLSGTDMLSADKTVTVNAGGALLAPSKTILDALRADGRFTINAASPIGLYDTWDITAADPNRVFYYSGNALIADDNTATLPNGLILAGGLVRIGLDGVAGDSVFGSINAPLILNGTTIKNNDNSPILAAVRTITVNQGGVTFTAGWSKDFSVLSKLTGSGSVNINCDNGSVVLANTDNDYSGNTIIGAQWAGYTGSTATLKLGASEVIPHGVGKGDLIFENAGALDMNGFDETVNGLSSSSVNALVTNTTVKLAVLTVGANDADGSFNGAIGGAVSLVKSGSGTQTLTGVCGSMADIVVEGGTLTLGESCAVASKNVQVKRGGTLDLNSADVFGGSASQTRLYAGVDKSTQGQQAKIDIPSEVNVTVLHFAIDGVFKNAGTWGATGSGADNIDDTIFTGSGILTVLETGPASGTYLKVR